MVSEERMMNISSRILPKEEMLAVKHQKSSLKIGLITEHEDEENRVCLTPESVGLLVENGHQLIIQKDAGKKSGFADMEYSEQGARIVETLEETMKAQILLKVSPLNEKERSQLNKNHVLFTSLQMLNQCKAYFQSLIESKSTALAFEKIKDVTKAYPLIRSMSEIVGSTGIQIASYYLSHPKYGNGTMFGGIPGLKPTEIVILGAGTVGEYAAKAAIGVGAFVKVFDNDIYKLRRIQNNLRQKVYTSIIQPHTLKNALKDADVAIGALRAKDDISQSKVPTDMIEVMRPGSVIIDVSIDQGGVFETSRQTTHKDPVYQEYGITHYAVPNIASRVPFTASNVLSNYFTPLLLRMGESGGLSQFLKKNQGIRKGVYVYNGIVTNQHIGDTFDLNYRDLDLLLAVLH